LIIRSPGNRLVQQALALHAPRTRRRERLVLVEGRKAVADVLAAGAALAYALAVEGFRGEPLRALERARVPVHELAAPLFARISGTETSQGIAAVAREPEPDFAALAALPGPAPLAVLDRIQDPGNLGAILRTAAALGFRGALLARGSADPFAPKVVRASAATLFRLPIAASEDLASDLEMLAARGFAVVCAAPGGARPARVFAALAGRPVALVLGNEGEGIAPELAAREEARVWIPLAREVESLNAAAAFAMLGYELAARGG
jgi:TrmH family RNA methyltransferase